VSRLRDRWTPWVAVAALVLVVAVTVAIVRREPELSLAGRRDAALATEIAAASLLVAAAVATWRASTVFAMLLTGTALAWPATEWNTPVAGPVFTPGLVLYAAWPALLAAAALHGLDAQRLSKPAVVLLTVAFGSGVGLLGVGSAVVFDPAAQGCGECPTNPLLVADAPRLGHALGQIGLALTAAWAVAFALLALARIARASPARRRWSAPVLVPAAAAVLLWGVDAVHGLERGFVSNDPTDRTLRLAEAGALALVAVGVALARVRARRTRRALAQLVLDIGAAPMPGEVRAWLADSLGDPTIALLYRLEGGEWIDAEGRETALSPPAEGEATRVRVAGQDVFAVIHRRGLLDDPTLLSELVTTASLALEHDRLHAACRARLEQLRASRARIVAEADSQRRQLERDLHDGAQQRLVAVALTIRLARLRIAPDDAELETRLAAAEAGVRAAVVALRDVAHGLFPAVLAEEGLAAALEELSEQVPRLVPRSLPPGRFPSEVESAAYFATVESLRLTQHDVTVEAVAEEGELRVVIGAGNQTDSMMLQIQDRVGAVGGTAAVCDGRLRVEMPCAS
jgi:signal transduction histidine kinase